MVSGQRKPQTCWRRVHRVQFTQDIWALVGAAFALAGIGYLRWRDPDDEGLAGGYRALLVATGALSVGLALRVTGVV